MNKYIKYIIPFIIGGAAFFALRPQIQELRAYALLIATESLALVLCFFSNYIFRHQIAKQKYLYGNIFLGVHICLGLSMLSVYLAQWNI